MYLEEVFNEIKDMEDMEVLEGTYSSMDVNTTTNTPSQEDQDLLYDLYGVNEESEQSVLSTDSCEEIGTEAEVQEDVDDQLLLFP